MHREPGRAWVVVAHPDDETLFFGGLLRELAAARVRVDVVCATGSFGTPFLTSTRRSELQRACWRLGAKARVLGLTDAPGALDVQALQAALTALAREARPDTVYTHGVWGEYGHRHHSDVCVAVHRVFDGVLSLAGPLPAVRTRALGSQGLASKRRLAGEVYPSQGAVREWCSPEERFVRLSTAAVEVLAGIAHAPSPAEAADSFGARLRRGRLRTLARQALESFSGGQGFAETACIPPEVWKPAHQAFGARLLAALGEAQVMDFSKNSRRLGHMPQAGSGPRAKKARMSSSEASRPSGR